MAADPSAARPLVKPWSEVDNAMRRSVLIVDDHSAFRVWARTLLETNGFSVIGEAQDGSSAVAAAAALRPDVVLVDVGLPDVDGFAVTRRLLGAACRPAVVLISSRGAADYGDKIAQSGAHGFIPKADLSGVALNRVLDEKR